ncbi:MAG: GTPase Era [bacterium]
MNTANKNSTFKAGYITIAGKPNVGKSTLMNSFLERKISIVTPKPQTTRNRVLGILNGKDYQIIFLDTPGLITPKYQLQKSLVDTAKTSLKEADIILMMIDMYSKGPASEPIIKDLKSYKIPKFLIINKIDLFPKEHLLPMIYSYKSLNVFNEIIPVSALLNDGLDILFNTILKNLPTGQPFYSQDVISSEPERFFVAEIIREKIFFFYEKEVPYSTAVKIAEFKERSGRKDFIHAIIIVERDSQKGIIIGKQGGALKRVGMRARKDIEAFLGRSVFLKLEVRVQKKWRKNPAIIKGLGY